MPGTPDNLTPADADDYAPGPGEAVHMVTGPEWYAPQPGERVRSYGPRGPMGFGENQRLRRRAVRRKQRPQKTKTRYNHSPADWIERRRIQATGLCQAERQGMFRIIKCVCQEELGRCWRGGDVAPEQVQRVVEAAVHGAREAGLRITRRTIAERVSFWLTMHNPAKALWFRFCDVARACDILAGCLSNAQLEEVNRQEHGRHIDRLTLGLVLCVVVKNTLVENRRTRREECGTKAIRAFLRQQGFANLDHGTTVRLCLEILAKVGLIRCRDPRFEVGATCRRWVPAGASWSLPFVADLKDNELTPAMRQEREKYHAAPATVTPIGTDVVRSHRIRETTPTQPNMDHSHHGQGRAKTSSNCSFLGTMATQHLEFTRYWPN